MLDIYHRYSAIDEAMRKDITGKTKRLLEVGSAGCGYGRYFKPGKWELTSIDIQKIPELERRRYPHINFIQYEGKKLPFKDKSFDTVICVDTLEHIPYNQRPAFIKELKRVCGGQILMIFPHDKSAKAEERFRKIIAAISGGRLENQPLKEHLDCILPKIDDVDGMINDKSFTIVSKRENLNLNFWIPLKGFSSLIFPLLRTRTKAHVALLQIYKRTFYPALNFGAGYSVFVLAKRVDR